MLQLDRRLTEFYVVSALTLLTRSLGVRNGIWPVKTASKPLEILSWQFLL